MNVIQQVPVSAMGIAIMGWCDLIANICASSWLSGKLEVLNMFYVHHFGGELLIVGVLNRSRKIA